MSGNSSHRAYTALLLCCLLVCGCSQFHASEFADSTIEQYAIPPNPTSLPEDLSIQLDETAASYSDAAHRLTDFSSEDLTLDLAIQLALSNSTFFRDQHQFLSRGNSILSQPLQAPSSFDPLIQQAGEQSVENALSAYSPNLTVGGLWGQNSIVQANPSVSSSDVLLNDNASAYARIYKPLKSGGIVSLTQNLNYSAGDAANQLLNSDYAGFLRGEIRQPLLAGRGKTFTDIAGPLSYRSRTLGHGLSVAKIKEELPQLNQQASQTKLIRQTEELYWNLWLAERTWQHHDSASKHAKHLWDRISNRASTGLQGGSAADVSQVEGNYYRHLKSLENSSSRLDDAQIRLRRILGVSAFELRTFSSSQNPTEARLVFDVQDTAAIAFDQRVESRRLQIQKHILELQLIPAKSLTRPQLDLIAGAQLNGLGENIFNGSSGSSPIDVDDAGWNVGLELSMPLGLKKERQFVHALELQISKAEAALTEQQNEIAHEVDHAISQAEHKYSNLEISRKSLAAAERKTSAMEAEFNEGRASLDRMLEAQMSLLEARIELDRAIVEYNNAVAEVTYRRGG